VDRKTGAGTRSFACGPLRDVESLKDAAPACGWRGGACNQVRM